MKALTLILAAVTAAVVFTLDQILPDPMPADLVFDSPLLLALLNIAFLCLSFFLVAYVASRAYMANGTVNLLLMGCGALAFASFSLVAGWLRGLPGGANLAVTLHNTGAALGGLLQFVSALPRSFRASTPPGRRRTILTTSCLGILLATAALAAAALQGALPTFLNPATGPTPLRQAVMGLAVALFFAAAYLLSLRYARSGSSFLYWYAMGLVFIALGLMTILWYRTIGDPLAWAGRVSQYLGGVYLFAAVWISFKTSRAEKVPVQSVLAKIFRDPRELHAAVVETVTDAIISIDRDGRVLLWNRAAETMFGYTREEATSSDLGKLISPEPRSGDPSGHFAMPSAERREGSVRPAAELFLKRKSGEVFPAEMTVSGTLLSGQWIGTFALRDITLRRNTERAREKHLARLNALLSFSQQVLSAANPEEILKMTVDVAREVTGARIAVSGHHFRDGVFLLGATSRAADAPPCPSPEGICSGERGGVHLEILRSGKTVRHTESDLSNHPAWWGLPEGHVPLRGLMGSVLADRNGLPGGIIMVSDRDKGEFTEAEEVLLGQLAAIASLGIRQTESRIKELESSNRALQEFAFIASHDLQEPLRKIRSFGDMIQTKFSDRLPADGLDYLQRMQNAASRMQTLIHSLLSYSRVSTQARPFAHVDLRQPALEALSNLELQVRETGGQVEIGELPTIRADEVQMVQLFQNLLSNALKFSGRTRPPRVRIYSPRDGEPGAPRDGRPEVLVEDNGIGFDEKHAERIFAPFLRLHGRGEYEGTGMGLPICRRIVERHGGTIMARSSPGKGSTFVIAFPRDILEQEMEK